MGKNKLERFAEMATFRNVVQPNISYKNLHDHELKGRWAEIFFKNNNPIVLELGCGKGEYTLALARKNQNVNYIGIDIKGARIWRGAKTAIEEKLDNVGFLRTKIDFLSAFFAQNEISEIWITFPDPQPNKPRKRLTSAKFLNIYRNFVKHDAIIHLKTDNQMLHHYTKHLLKANFVDILQATDDLYANKNLEDILYVKTFYEQMWLNEGKKITYLKFKIQPEQIFLDVKDFDYSSYKM